MNRLLAIDRARTSTIAVRAAAAPAHLDLAVDDFWRRLRAYRDVDHTTFLDHRFQAKRSIDKPAALQRVVGDCAPERFFDELAAGLTRAPMSVRLTPYLIALIDWTRPFEDPIRRQFLPLRCELRPDHPMARFDSLAERALSPVPGLVHRYRDRALFLARDRCPVYCRFCTRSYAVGHDTQRLEKDRAGMRTERWERAFRYVESSKEIEDVIVSGGDSYALRADEITAIGDRLLAMPHVRRVRFATKGLGVAPMKVLTDSAWTEALLGVAQRGRERQIEVAVHTHINHPREVTGITRLAVARLYQAGVTVRNQAVLLRGVNDDADTLRLLVRRLSALQVQPYYVHQHDLVRGVEDLRTSIATAQHLEKELRGAAAGQHTPAFVVDLPGGGGKRDVHSSEHYDVATGVSVFWSPNIDRRALFTYFDPIDSLPPEGQARWADPDQHERIVREAVSAARSKG